MWVRSLDWEDPLTSKWQATPVFLPENPMDREAWRAAVHGVEKSQTRLKWLSTHNESCKAKSLWCLGRCSEGVAESGLPSTPEAQSVVAHLYFSDWLPHLVRGKNHLFWHLGILGRVEGRIKINECLVINFKKSLNSYWHFQWILNWADELKRLLLIVHNHGLITGVTQALVRQRGGCLLAKVGCAFHLLVLGAPTSCCFCPSERDHWLLLHFSKAP